MTNSSQNSSKNGLKAAIADNVHGREDQFLHERKWWDPLGIQLSIHHCRSEEDLIEHLSDAEAVIFLGPSTPFTTRVVGELKQCGLIMRYGVGLDSLDVAAATRAGIVVANSAQANTQEVSDHAVALLLATARRVVSLDRDLKSRSWSETWQNVRATRVTRMANLTLGLVGFGRIPRLVTGKMSALVGEIIAHDPYVSTETAGELGVGLVSLDELASRSDLISVHAPLNPATRHLINAEFFTRMKPTAYLVNTSRGPVVDEAALIEALNKGEFAGAGLDVFETEPLPEESPLRSMYPVILTPHFAYYSEQSVEDTQTCVAETVARFAQGYWPRFVVNPEVQPRVTLRNWAG